MPTFPHLAENNVRTGFLEDSQFDKLVENAELWVRALVECGATISWRHHELLPLRAKQSISSTVSSALNLAPPRTKKGARHP
jgi:hypothetical protein